jgi:hypothetical protein
LGMFAKPFGEGINPLATGVVSLEKYNVPGV